MARAEMIMVLVNETDLWFVCYEHLYEYPKRQNIKNLHIITMIVKDDKDNMIVHSISSSMWIEGQ